MAMESTLTIEYSAKNLNLEEFVKNATWRELLVELVDSNKIDPWNIDLIKVVDGYIAFIKQMKVLDLHVPANIILAASILLRLKSETIKIFEIEEPVQEMEEPLQTGPRVYPEVPPLVPRIRLQPSRKITLIELMDALNQAMKVKEDRESFIEEAHQIVPFYINKEDIDEKIDNIYSMVSGNLDKEGFTTFADLANKFTHEESILLDLFIPLLFLAHKGRVLIIQEKFFDEIIIKLDGKDGTRAG